VGFDVNARRMIGKIILPAGVVLPDSHMNDLRIDLVRRPEQ
jgi:hypothetical protein